MATLQEITRSKLEKAAQDVRVARRALDEAVLELLSYNTRDERFATLQNSIAQLSRQVSDACEAYAEAYSDAVEADLPETMGGAC